MQQDNSRNANGAGVRSLALYSIWHVDADASYDVTVSPWTWKRLVALRTLAGEGELTFVRGATVTRLPPGSVILFVGSQLQRYRCPGRRWHFWWFELDALEPPAMPLGEVLAVAPEAGDERLFTEAFSALRRETPAQLGVAAAVVQLLLHRWQARWAGTVRTSPRQRTVERLIDLMHRKLDGSLSLPLMAAEAHLSVPHLRRVFQTVTGQAPKSYYDGLRLERGRQLLAQQQLNVGETAAALGFASPFHFSRAFRQRFGYPPKLAARRQA